MPTQPVDWPEGTVLVVGPTLEDDDLTGSDPESIARWLAWYETLPVPELSEAEWDEVCAARREMKEYTIAKMYRERPVE